MRIEGFVPAAVVDDDRLAGGAVAQRHLLDRPVGRSEDARTFGNGVVDALMRAQHLLERIDTHAVGGGEQRQLLVDDRLDGRYPVAVGAAVDRRCHAVVGVRQIGDGALGGVEPSGELLLQLDSRLRQQPFVEIPAVGGVLLLEIVGIGLEEDVEDVAVARDDVLHDAIQRVVPPGERRVLPSQPVGRVFEPVLHRRVEEDREGEVVEHGGARPDEELDDDARDVVPECLAAADFGYVSAVGHGVNRFPWLFRASPP